MSKVGQQLGPGATLTSINGRNSHALDAGFLLVTILEDRSDAREELDLHSHSGYSGSHHR